ncbi:hypothetical protein EK21DRAFT_113347 [Setomelanomma holmii]|uniref:Heterokaryon incompatibility domain-containing protein n=1 Tax=Setomelanomma holmii TaxID=210430 RepID=A0A9P4H7A4_9PLEO|nr:hypothetical protein EK21DRAFT_113347 [Setomelanomma holmii]
MSSLSECTLWLYWDEEVGSYTRLRFVLRQEFGNCADDGVRDTFEPLPIDEDCSSESTELEEPSESPSLRELLPCVIQAACLVAEALGFRYIRIDSLCVIQDSNEDLLREILMRALAIQHCAINITADSSEAILRALPRDDAPKSPGSDDSTSSCQPFLSKSSRCRIIPEDLRSAEMICSPLSQDAVCFQDELFPARKLHFGKTQIFWQCAEMKACEMFQHGLPQRMLQNPINDGIMESVPRQVQELMSWQPSLPTLPPSDTPASWIEVWHQLVSRYSRCSSPTRGMKLLGICGIANELELLSRDTYIADLWKGNFINDLLWCTDGSCAQRPELSCAPSWNWASVDGPITYLSSSELYGNFVKITNIEAAGAEGNMINEHTVTASLKLHGYLLKLLPGGFSPGSMFPDCQDDITEAHHFCLSLRLRKSARGEYLCDLVLRLIEAQWGAVFERVGVFRFREGDELHNLGLEKFGNAYIFTEEPRDSLNQCAMVENIMIL